MYLNSLYGVNKDWNEFYEKLLLHSSSVMQSVYIKNLSDGFVHGFGPPPLLQEGLNYIMSAYSSAVTYSLRRFEVCLLSAKLHVIWPSSLKQQVSKACIIRKERFVAQ